jgi:radical SAM protein with 4Fe4S-binding SPASM domain
MFGQVNVSVDAVDGRGESARASSAAAAMKAIDLLLEAGVNVGLNCVVTRQNFDHLSGVIAFAAERGLSDVELLRFKPSGRGRRDYFQRRLTPVQNRQFYPAIKRLFEEYGIPAKIDCSFVPMFCWHRPEKRTMEEFSVYGCEAGNVLLGVRSDGTFAGCSFLSSHGSIFDFPRLWRASEHLTFLRNWNDRALEPCRVCEYLEICKGGCRAVAAFVAGDPSAPDPECPFADGADNNHEKGK